MCLYERALTPVVQSSPGFSLINEGSVEKHKWGYVAKSPGSELVLKLNVSGIWVVKTEGETASAAAAGRVTSGAAAGNGGGAAAGAAATGGGGGSDETVVDRRPSRRAVIYIAYLKSYEHMGAAAVG